MEMVKLDSLCKGFKTRLLRSFDELKEKVKVPLGENGVLCQGVKAMEHYY